MDPNFLFLSARTPAELEEKRKSVAGQFIKDRQEALERYIAQANSLLQKKLETAGNGAETSEQRMVDFLKEKYTANLLLSNIYAGSDTPDIEQGFLEAGNKAWSQFLPEVLNELDSKIVGVYALGDQVVS